jgi:hypothetical protein
VSRAKETAAAINQQLVDLQAELEAEVASLQAAHDPAQQELETLRSSEEDGRGGEVDSGER